jgi:predicted RNA-binding Zn-ribbon protein involved in translation (DUF1610 family)
MQTERTTRNKNLKFYYCPICGNKKTRNAKNCKKCSNLLKKEQGFTKKIYPKILSREQLKDEIRNFTFVELSQKYNVSRNTIKNWCIFYNLPNTRNEILNYSNEEWQKI